MKKLNRRILSALLAFLLFLSNFPAVSAAKDNFAITYEGKTVKQVEFYEYEKITVSVEGIPEGSSCQWQIQIPGTEQWVDIHGQTAEELGLSKAVVGSLMVDGSAYVRCAATGDAETNYTDALQVTVKETEFTQQENVIAAPVETVPKATEAPVEETTKATEAPVEETTKATEAPVEETTEATEASAEETTEVTTEATEAPAEQTDIPETTVPVQTEAAEVVVAPEEQTPAETEVPAEELTEATEATAVPTEETTEPAVEAAEGPVEIFIEKLAETFGLRANGAIEKGEPAPVAENGEVKIVTVTILYRAVDRYGKFEKTQLDASLKENAAQAVNAADPDTAHIVSGSPLNVTIPCQVIPGYALTIPSFYQSNNPGMTVSDNDLQLNLTNVAEDTTLYIYYVEKMVRYSARYFMQNVYNDLYTERTDILQQNVKDQMFGFSGDQPDEKIIYPIYPGEDGRPGNENVKGFTPLFFQPDKIAADGSTVFEVYYDRNYYLMNFNMDGGFGTAPIYARYGTAFTVANPQKSGNSFASWELEKVNGVAATTEQKNQTFPTMIPAENRTYKAIWTQLPTTYSIAYWIVDDKGTENPTDDVKTYLGGVHNVPAITGDQVSGTNNLKQADGKSILLCGEEESATHTHSDETCRINATDMKYIDFVKSDENVVVEGDGSTVINIYYEYRQYTLKFYYAKTKGGTDSEDDADEIPDKDFETVEVVGGSTWNFGYTGDQTARSEATDNDATLLLNVSEWGQITEFPKLKRNNDVYTQSAIKIGDYWYHYLSFEARYGDDISTLWPCDVINPATRSDPNTKSSWKGTTAQVSAWNGEHFVRYTQQGGNPTIKGLYERLDEMLLLDSSASDSSKIQDWGTVSYLCFWENGADVGWSIPELYVYNIWKECLLDKNQQPIQPVDSQGNPKRIKKYNGVSYYLDQSYYTCDDSNIYSQTTPSITGYTYRKANRDKEWSVIFLSQTKKSGYSNYTTSGATNPASYNSNSKIVYDGGSSWSVYQELNISPQQTDGTYIVYDPEVYNPEAPTAELNHTAYRDAYYRDYYFNSNKGHTLYFWNRDGYLVDGKGVPLDFATPLQVYGDTVNAAYMKDYYPEKLERDAYYFDGWYTTSACLPGTEMDWTRSMPDSDLTVYAKWVPVTHKVSFYMDYARYEQKKPFHVVDETAHGTSILSENLNAIQNLKFKDETGTVNNEYRFVNWFYIDESGAKKAFNPAEMAVRKELHLFAEWTTNIVKEYTVSYQHGVWDESKNEYVSVTPAFTMAENSKGYALEATTKTFSAQPVNKLTAFPAGTQDALWLPHTNSHSIIMRSDNSENVFTFYYIKKEKAPYKVRYLNAADSQPLAADADYPDNTSAVITETFKYIEGYIPDAFHKELILSANDEENVIIFYYTKDDFEIDDGGSGGGGSEDDPKRSIYLVAHHYPELDGTELVDKTSSVGVIGETATAEEAPLPGFEIDEEKTREEYCKRFGENSDTGNVKVENERLTVSGTITSGADTNVNKALELHLYYKRITYNYIIIYKNRESGQVIEEETSKNKVPFGTTLEIKAKEIQGYDIYAPDEDGTKTLPLKISHVPQMNVVTFEYMPKKVTINYVPVCTRAGLTGFGGVSVPIEHDKQTPSGSQAYATSGYHFIGWYENWGENNQQLVSQEARYVPKIELSKGIYEYTYYAVFEPITMTISQSNMAATDSAIYEVVQGTNTVARVMLTGTDSVTLYAIPAGNYTIQEISGNWTWTYTDTAPRDDVIVVAGQNNQVSFSYTAKNIPWLHSETHN